MAKFTTLEGHSWELSKGSFDEPIIAIFTDDGDKYPIAHLDTAPYSPAEYEANARLLLHSREMYFLLQKIIKDRKCNAKEVRDLLKAIDVDEEEPQVPVIADNESDDEEDDT